MLIRSLAKVYKEPYVFSMRLFFYSALLLCCLFAAPSHALELNGEIKQGSLIFGKAEPGSTVRFDGKPLRQTEGGDFIFGFDREHGPDAKLLVSYPDGRTEERALAVEQRIYDVQRIDSLPGKMVNPPEDVRGRIADDRRRVAAARAFDTDAADFLEGFIWPAQGPISGVYGSQRILNGTPRQPHYGVDIAAPEGAPVIAPAAGIIRLAAKDLYYTGGTVIIDHGHNLSSTLMHMSAVYVSEGQRVERGDSIGAVGATGRATGPHLDWRMNWRDAHIDPVTIAPPHKGE